MIPTVALFVAIAIAVEIVGGIAFARWLGTRFDRLERELVRVRRASRWDRAAITARDEAAR